MRQPLGMAEELTVTTERVYDIPLLIE